MNHNIKLSKYSDTVRINRRCSYYKMNKRWKKKIYIYMWLDEQTTQNYGKKKLEIRSN